MIRRDLSQPLLEWKFDGERAYKQPGKDDFMVNHWHKRFQTDNYVYGKEPNIFLAAMQKRLDISGDALAIAEGEGRNAVYLAEQGMRVTTWDFAPSMYVSSGHFPIKFREKTLQGIRTAVKPEGIFMNKSRTHVTSVVR